MSGTQLVQVVEMALMVPTTLLLLWIAVPEVAPWRAAWESLCGAFRSPRRVLYLAAGCSILAVNYLYLHLGLDERFTGWVVESRGRDYTSSIHSLEGEAVAGIQSALAWLPLTWFFAYVYVIVFPCFVFVAMLVFDRLRSKRGLAMVLIGYFLNYLVELPFFVVFPVRETFHFYQHDLGSQGVRLLLDDISPVVMEAYRAMSGLDNCFPSFHTSLGVTMALVSWHTGRRSFALVMTGFGLANALATLYLGIHWVSDVAAGAAVGVLAYVFARWLSRRWAQEPQ